MAKPLDGIRVVDCSVGAHGPYAGALLADLGADVVKIEPPGGELMRQSRGGGGPAKKGHQLAYMGLNHGKRSIVLDLRNPEDRVTALDLVKRSDVFLENWRGGVASDLRVGYDDLSKINPKLIYISGSAHGYNSPYRTKAGADGFSQDMSAMGSISGPADGRPEKARFTILDLTTPLPLVQGVLMALLAREKTGEGQWVQCSQTETGIVYQAVRMAEYFATGRKPEPMGSASPSIVPSQAFKTRDGYVDVEAPTQPAWGGLCRALGMTELANDPRFSTNSARVEHRQELVPLLEAKFLDRTSDEWVSQLEAEDVPAATVVWSIADLYTNPQIVANELIITREHELAGTIQVPEVPWIFSGTPVEYPGVGPVLGAHQDEVMRELEEQGPAARR